MAPGPAVGWAVAEMLASLVPLCADAGVETDWLVMDAPEAFFEVTRTVHNDDPDVHLLSDLPDAGVNAFQRGADVVLQKSLREGFALTVSEALWKRTPVVGSAVGGIPLQIDDGGNGYLVDYLDLLAALAGS